MTQTEAGERVVTVDQVGLREVLRIEQLDRDLFRAMPVHDDGRSLFGGQIAAQCLLACGATVPKDRFPHSLHGYFLRRGDSGQPVLYRVERDRDGGSYSARRGVALQGGEVLFSMAVSFRVGAEGAELDGEESAPMPPPAQCHPFPVGLPLEVRAAESLEHRRDLPTRFHVRPKGDLPPGDVLLHAAAVTYVSDFSAGLPMSLGGEVLGPSLDHALWFHDVPKWDGWLRVEYRPGVVGGKRGWYSGAVRDESGRRIASVAQEMVYRDDSSTTTTR